MTPVGKSRMAFVSVLAVAGLAGFFRPAQAAPPPADDWTSDLTECVWTNGVSTTCLLTMSSPVDTMSITGTDTNTTYEFLASSDWSILARKFDANRPTIEFSTNAVGGAIRSVSFRHYHNHSAGHAPNSYTVKMEIYEESSNTWSAFGDPYLVQNVGTFPIYPGEKTVTAASDFVLRPNDAYALRWSVTDNGTGFSNFTNASFYGITNLVMGFKKNQTVSITQAPNATAGGTANVVASSTSGLPLTWGDTAGICTAAPTSSGAAVSLLAAGTCTLTATQPGNAVWVAAQTQTMSFQVQAPVTTTTSTSTTTTPTTTSTSTTTVTNVASAAPATPTAAAPTATTAPPSASGRSSAPVAASPTSTTVASTTTTSPPAGVSTTAPLQTAPPDTTAGQAPAQLAPTNLDVLTLGSSPVRLMAMSTSMQPGQAVAGSSVSMSPRGLAPGSTVTVTLLPGSVVLSTQTVDSAGAATFAVNLPAGLAAGTYSIVMSGQTATNGPVSSIIHFETNSAGSAVKVLPAYETVGPPPSGAAIARALQAGVAPYDVVREVPTTAALSMSAVILMGLVGVTGTATAGGSGRRTTRRKPGAQQQRDAASGPEERDATAGRRDDAPTERTGSSTEESAGRDSDAEGSFGSSDANLFGASSADEEKWGDRLRPWVTFGYDRFDRWLRSLVAVVSTRSVLATRLVQDGTWMRAATGSAEITVLLAGLATGVLGALSVGAMALSPSLAFVAVVAVLSLLNGLSGALAWLGFTVVVVVNGNLSTLFDVRTLIGLALVFFALPSIASAIRPLYDDGSRPVLHRVGDYVMMPVFLAYGSASIYTALNGLSGLALVSSQDATTLRNIVFVAAVARLAAEDVVRRGFPVRVATVSIEATGSPGLGAEIAKRVFAAALYTMAIVTFYGWGARTVLMIVLTSAVPVIGMFSDGFPNLARVHRWFPRGILRTVIMIFVGTWYGRFIMTLADNPSDTRRIAALLLLPGIVLGLIDCFAREGGEWPERTAKHVAGFALWLFSLAVLVGAVSI